MAFRRPERCETCNGILSIVFLQDDPNLLVGPGVWEKSCRLRCTVIDLGSKEFPST